MKTAALLFFTALLNLHCRENIAQQTKNDVVEVQRNATVSMSDELNGLSITAQPANDKTYQQTKAEIKRIKMDLSKQKLPDDSLSASAKAM